jgi:hypothetical protein
VDAAEVQNTLACARAHAMIRSEAQFCVEELKTGYLIFAGQDTPLTCATGVGASSPLTCGELDRLADFFESRGTAPCIHVSNKSEGPVYQQLRPMVICSAARW